MSNYEEGGGLRPALPSRWQVAVHEAAHAVCNHRQGIAVVYVTVEGIVAVENGGERGEFFGRCQLDWDGEAGPITGVLGCALFLVGPAAAFRAGWPEPLLPYAVLERDAETIHPRSDVGKALALSRSASDPADFYEAARADAEAFVAAHWEDITKLAAKLMEVETLGGSSISSLLGPGWAEFREMLDEMRMEEDRPPWLKAEHEAEEQYD